ncbi:MAG: ribonuclease HI family protein [Candidatus Uhrbacteria bacterium]|nr:ribonuclease HI family protein [Patescibacteria group bacterium]MBU1907103.1 ribonuclease HI family protein [Patescibacteria group bacterium]
MSYRKLEIYTDGGARGNPGPAAAGAVLKADGEVVDSLSRYLGETTNNQAEYRAILMGLERAHMLGAEEVDMYMDTELACKQLNGEYKVKDPELAKLFVKVWNLTHEFKKVTFTHVRREKNKEADALVNKSLDEHTKA